MKGSFLPLLASFSVTPHSQLAMPVASDYRVMQENLIVPKIFLLFCPLILFPELNLVDFVTHFYHVEKLNAYPTIQGA